MLFSFLWNERVTGWGLPSMWDPAVFCALPDYIDKFTSRGAHRKYTFYPFWFDFYTLFTF